MSSSPLRVEGCAFLKSACRARVGAQGWRRARGAVQWTDRLGEQALRSRGRARCSLNTSHGSWTNVASRVACRGPVWADWASCGFAPQDARVRLYVPALARGTSLPAFDAVERTVQGLRSLVDVEPGPVTRQDAASHLAGDALATPALRPRFVRLRRALRPLRHVIGVDLDAIVVLGMAEVSFPRLAATAPCSHRPSARLLGRRVRKTLGSEKSGARTSPRSGPRRAGGCRVLERLRAGGTRGALVGQRGGRASDPPSFDAELAALVGPPASCHEPRLAAAAGDRSVAGVEAPPRRGRRGWLVVTAIEARMSPEFTEFDGNIGVTKPSRSRT